MKIVNHWTNIETTPVDMKGVKDVVKRLVLGPADGTPTMAVRVFTIAPGGHSPYHQHPFEHINVVLEGQGVLRGADGESPLITFTDGVSAADSPCRICGGGRLPGISLA